MSLLILRFSWMESRLATRETFEPKKNAFVPISAELSSRQMVIWCTVLSFASLSAISSMTLLIRYGILRLRRDSGCICSKIISRRCAKAVLPWFLVEITIPLTRIFHESLAATTDMAVLPGVLGCRPLRRTVQVRLGTNTLWLPGGTPIFVVSRQQFMKYPD